MLVFLGFATFPVLIALALVLRSFNESSVVPAIIFGVTFFLGVALIVLVFYAARIMPNSINALIKGTQILGAGHLDEKINIKSGDEFEDLATAFNEMAEKLKNSVYKLTAERNKMQVVLSGIRDGVIAVDLEHKVILFNKAAEDLTGYKQEEVLGKNITHILRVFDKNSEITVSEYCPIRYDEFEGILFQKNALRILVKEKLLFANFSSGKISEGANVNLGCLLTLHDVSVEQQLEAMKLDFVSMAAHELRTPLTSVRGYADILKSQIWDRLNQEEKEYFYRLQTSADNLGNLIDNLLSAAKIERGAFKVERKPLDLVGHIRSIVDNFQEHARTKQQTLKFIEPQDLIPLVQADGFRIGQVVSNLLSNAINYTYPAGSIEVSVHIIKSEIARSMVSVSVKDTGQGIPKSALPHLFTKFFRVSGSLEAGSKGTGLGLFICKSIVNLHEGEIWVESIEGKGSTFTFTVPVATQADIEGYHNKKMLNGFVRPDSHAIIRRA